MPGLILPPWPLQLAPRGQVKPSGIPRIDWAHPLTQQLEFYGFDTGGVVVDLVRGRPASFVGVPDLVSVSPWGMGTKYSGASAQTFASDTLIRTYSTNQFSAAVAYVQTGTVGTFARPFTRTNNNGASAPFWNWDWEINGSPSGQNNVVANYNGTTSGVNIATFGSNANNVFTSLVMTIDGNIPACSAYAQGQILTSGATPQVPGTVTTNDNIIFAASSAASATNPFIGFVFYGAYWTRPLRADEVLFLHNNPYDFLIPQEPEMMAAFTPPVIPIMGQIWI